MNDKPQALDRRAGSIPWQAALPRPGKDTLVAWGMVLPALIGFAIFYAYPLLQAVRTSFTDWNLLSAPGWVGWSNYAELWQDDKFWHALRITFYYVVLNIPLQTALGLFLAAAMDRLLRSVALRAVVLFPYLLSNVLVAMIWLWQLDPTLGWVNHALEAVGLSSHAYFSDPDESLLTIAGVNIWRHMGLVALLFLAGMQSIPRDLYEAAAIDGASEWQMFRRITLPLLRPVMVFVLVTSVTGSLQIFDTVAVATAGGPAESTRVLVYYIYENAFSYYRMGYASALSVVLCLIMVLYTFVQMRLLNANQSDLA